MQIAIGYCPDHLIKRPGRNRRKDRRELCWSADTTLSVCQRGHVKVPCDLNALDRAVSALKHRIMKTEQDLECFSGSNLSPLGVFLQIGLERDRQALQLLEEAIHASGTTV
jgi:hypothetical protein